MNPSSESKSGSESGSGSNPLSSEPAAAPSKASLEPGRQSTRWELMILVGILILAGGLRMWHLGQNGYCNLYFSAGVRSMMLSWHNFIYAAFDPGGSISIDKPPVAYWIQTVFSKIIGFNAYGLLLPQALCGLISIALVYSIVRRTFGAMAGLIAALVLAVTPMSVAMDRHNNADSLMVFFLVAAAWALFRALENGKLRWLLGSMALAGVAFNTKMLLAFVAMPAFYLAYFAGAKLSWKARFGHLTAATAVLGLVSISWPLLFDLTPPEQRPLAASTTNNSMISLATGWNGVARIAGTQGRNFAFRRRNNNNGPRANTRPGNRPGVRAANTERPGRDRAQSEIAPLRGPGPGFGGGPNGIFGIGDPGWLRFRTKSLAAQIIWLWPLALGGALAVATRTRLKFPLEREHQQLLFWSAWLLTMGAVFSFAVGITHSYYTLQMAPPLAALSGISVAALWSEHKARRWRSWFLPVLLFTEAWWTAYLLSGYPAWGKRLALVLWIGVGAGTAVFVICQFFDPAKRIASRMAAIGLALAITGVLAGPTAWSVTPAMVAASAVRPSAGPELLSRSNNGPNDFGNALEENKSLIEYLHAHQGKERWLLATASVTEAAPLIVATGQGILPLGGWRGVDATVSLDGLKELIKNNELRFVLLSPGFNMRGGTDECARWIRDNATPVPRKRWHKQVAESRSDPAGRNPFGGFAGFGGPGAFGGAGRGLYDCQGVQ